MPIFRVSIETRNILSLLQISKSSQILSKNRSLLLCQRNEFLFIFSFFFFLRHALTGIPLYNARSLHNCQHAMLLLPGRNSVQHSAGKKDSNFFRRDVYSDFLVESSFFIHEIDGSLVQYKQVFTKILILSMLSSQEVYRYTLRILGEIYSK